LKTDQIQSLITTTAIAKGVDPNLALAVAQAESSYDPNARSKAGAMGVFQLMPSTARSYGVTDPYDPAQNINAGVTMLADLNRQYNGDLPSILAAYNWGSGNLATGAALPTETQNYIAKILRLLGIDLLFSPDSPDPRKAPQPIRRAGTPPKTIPPAA
jgi:soluble lytic murein transglycosylase-like protein